MRIKKTFQGALPENKIVNTQSDSQTDTYSCDYINGIVESGENANGSWTKWADGTMICNGTIHINATFVSWGALYGYDDTNIHNFPQTFTDIDTCIIQANTNSSGGAMINQCKYTNSQITTIGIVRATSANGNYYVDYIAKGKWK